MELETPWGDVRFEMRYTEFIALVVFILLAAFIVSAATSDPSSGEQVAVQATEVTRGYA
mgnify:CR=1 FL=1